MGRTKIRRIKTKTRKTRKTRKPRKTMKGGWWRQKPSEWMHFSEQDKKTYCMMSYQGTSAKKGDYHYDAAQNKCVNGKDMSTYSMAPMSTSMASPNQQMSSLGN